jgi:hypothetical protein
MDWISWQEQEILLFSKTSRPDLAHTQPPIQWIMGAFPDRIKWPGCEVDHSLPSVLMLRMS